MLTVERDRIQRQRDSKAATIRTLRAVPGITHHTIQELARIQHGKPQRVAPEVLADYWPVQCQGEVLASFRGDAESWSAVYLCPADWDDEQIADLGIWEHYGGPGRPFSNHPSIERSTAHVLVHWSGGLDI